MVALTPAPNQFEVLTALRNFLLAVMPPGMPIIQGQSNRVAQPKASDFIVFTPTRQTRLETNIDSYQDVSFVASIAGDVLTVEQVLLGTITIGSTLSAVGLASGTTTIVDQIDGIPGEVGTYQVSQSQTVALTKFAAGGQTYMQPSELVVQIDVHGPNAADNTQVITTLFRDDFAVQQFIGYGFDVAPLYADDPKQIPFINAEDQYEDRWIIEAHLQTNPVVKLPQQFADQLEVDLNILT